MKTARFVLKIVSASLGFAALVCGIIGWWDRLTGSYQSYDRLYRNARTDRTRPFQADDYKDYEDMNY
jgi:hypothetical protein